MNYFENEENKFKKFNFFGSFALFIPKKNEKGSTLVEILVSMAILAFLLTGILQMFGAAFVINQKSATRTWQAYKCQQVAEVLRIVWNVNRRTGMLPANAADSGIQFQSGFVGTLPYKDGDPNWSYWGPAGANIIETSEGPYRIFYRIDTEPINNNFILTISAVDAKLLNDGEDPYVARPNVRRIDYVMQLQNN